MTNHRPHRAMAMAYPGLRPKWVALASVVIALGAGGLVDPSVAEADVYDCAVKLEAQLRSSDVWQDYWGDGLFHEQLVFEGGDAGSVSGAAPTCVATDADERQAWDEGGDDSGQVPLSMSLPFKNARIREGWTGRGTCVSWIAQYQSGVAQVWTPDYEGSMQFDAQSLDGSVWQLNLYGWGMSGSAVLELDSGENAASDCSFDYSRPVSLRGVLHLEALPSLAPCLDLGSAHAGCPTEPAGAGPPANSVAPRVLGSVREGRTVSAAKGRWSGATPMAFGYQWQRQSSQTGEWADVLGAVAPHYTPAQDDVGDSLRVVVSGSNAAGSAAVTSAAVYVGAGAPRNTVRPRINGVARAGATLTADEGSWEQTGPPAWGYPYYSYQWQSCWTDDGSQCQDVQGATGRSYKIWAGYAPSPGYPITWRVKVGASGWGGYAEATSLPTTRTLPGSPPPENASQPTISGTARDGQTLTAQPGSWTGAEPRVLSYQWQRCTNSWSEVCHDIPGAATQSYTLGHDDVGAAVRVVVTATNKDNQGQAASPPTDLVAALAPENTLAPALVGLAREDQELHVTDGDWSGTPSITFAYHWERCDSNGNSCAPIDGANGQSYTLATADVGKRVRGVVTARNDAGSASVPSPASDAVVAARRAPANTSPPTISGTARDGETLTANEGSWSGDDPKAFSYQWERCSVGCLPILAANGKVYAVTADDFASTLRVAVTATNEVGTSPPATSAETQLVQAAPPQNVLPPQIAGFPQVGRELRVISGGWRGTEPITKTYQWQRCDSSGNCEVIDGAAGQTYTPTTTDVHRRIKVSEAGRNSAGSASADSVPTAPILSAQTPPRNTSSPSISGTARDGETLTANRGSWVGEDLGYAYQWRRCTTTITFTCTDIASATATTYTLSSADVNSYITVRVTGSNSAGEASSESSAVGPVAAVAPANTTPPSISGTLHTGQTATANRGGWTGSTPISYTYYWQRCTNTNAASCSDIGGATETTYTLVDADVARYVRVRVTGSNSGGSANAVSAATGVVEGPPVADAPPTVMGDVVEGATVTAISAWRAAPAASHAYQWLRCTSTDISSCNEIVPATSATYVLTGTDVGKYVRVEVTASNTWGATSSMSGPAGSIAAARPVNTVLPTISGTLRDGETITATSGSWNGVTPMQFGYQWRRCETADAESCSNIDGETQSTYTLTSADVGKRIRMRVTATNEGGSATVETPPTAPVEGLPPVNTTLPESSGVAVDGNELTATDGSWTGSTPLSFTYRWVRCDADGSGCTDIPGPDAIGNRYQLTSADIGSRIRIRVTATNPAGSEPALSALSDVVQMGPPINTDSPTVTGETQSEETLTASLGTWVGTTPMSFAYQWQRCLPECGDISGATEQSYSLTALDVGSTVRVRVTATNLVASVGENSSPTALVLAGTPRHPPQNQERPAITGVARDGEQLTATKGRWTGSEPTAYRYQWRRCNQTGADCQDIVGAVRDTYTSAAADINSTLRVMVEARNSVDTTPAFSDATALVAALAPKNTSPPQIVGIPRVGLPLQGTAGDWQGSQNLTQLFRWLRCDTNGNNCTEIGGGVGESYTVRVEDRGHRLRLRVIATNAGGTDSAVSAATQTVDG